MLINLNNTNIFKAFYGNNNLIDVTNIVTSLLNQEIKICNETFNCDLDYGFFKYLFVLFDNKTTEIFNENETIRFVKNEPEDNIKIGLIISTHISNDLDIYFLQNNLNKITSTCVDIYIYYSGIINDDFKTANNKCIFKEVENKNLDFGKYFKAYHDLINNYDYFILLNDSIIILETFNDYIDFCIKHRNNDLIGYLESLEKKLHYQSWCYFLSKNGFNILYEKFNNKSAHYIELNYPKEIFKKKVFFNAINTNNIFFNYDIYMLFYNKGFRILKKKQIIKQISKVNYKKYGSDIYLTNITIQELPEDFNLTLYKKYNTDLLILSDNDIIKHYLNHGFKEIRKYTTDNIFVIHKKFIDILKKYDMYETIKTFCKN